MRSVRTTAFLLCAVLVFATVSVAFRFDTAYAAQITPRTLTLVAGATDGGSKAGGVVNHAFSFTVPNAGNANIGSIKFEYCTTAALTCTMPTGLVTTSATMGSQTGATGFSINNATNGVPYITRTAASVNSNTALTYQLNSITNPTANNTSFFVRISTYTSTDTTGSPTDQGTVTASTAEAIVLSGIMPESIIFCTGADVPAIGNVPNCAAATSGVISFNQLFSPSDTATARSEMAASTNAPSGYVITVNGTTMTSGANTIPAMAARAAGVRGTGQFGMNLRANTLTTSTPIVGDDIFPTSDGTNLKGEPTADYAVIDEFKFVSGDTVATSTNGGAGPTNGQIFAASYIVNVAGNQLAGTYTTTLTYICTATF